MAEQIQGKITQIIGAVLDIKFPEGKLPKIYDAIHIAYLIRSWRSLLPQAR